MTARNGRSMWKVRYFLGLWCLAMLATRATIRGDGSIAFNGANSPASATSKLQNDDADVLDGSQQVTVCCWIYPDSDGETNGYVVTLDEETSDTAFVIFHASNNELLYIVKYAGMGTPGMWSIPVSDDEWSAVCVSLDFSDNNAPTARVNFSDVTPSQVIGPSGINIQPSAGYCVGNQDDQSVTWDGRIAHMQVFNRNLSAAEADAAVRAPGSVKQSLRLWLPMQSDSDTEDKSGNDFDGTGTDLDTGTDGPIVNSEQDVPAGIVRLPASIHTVAQHEIPRYADGTSYPAGGVVGYGRLCVIQGNSATQYASDPYVVVTQGSHQSLSQWQGSPSPNPAFLGGLLADVTIAGWDETASNYTDEGVVSDSWQENYDQDIREGGLHWQGAGGTTRNLRFFYIRGIAGK